MRFGVLKRRNVAFATIWEIEFVVPVVDLQEENICWGWTVVVEGVFVYKFGEIASETHFVERGLHVSQSEMAGSWPERVLGCTAEKLLLQIGHMQMQVFLRQAVALVSIQ